VGSVEALEILPIWETGLAGRGCISVCYQSRYSRRIVGVVSVGGGWVINTAA
jgi:hypothetical protein